jgi:ferredoxin
VTARYEAEVDQQLCTGAQLCVATAPGHFEYDDEVFASRGPAGPVAAEERIRLAAEACPVEAITLRDADTGERLFP